MGYHPLSYFTRFLPREYTVAFIQDSVKPSLALSSKRLKFSGEVCEAGSGTRLLTETALKVWKLHSWGFSGAVFIGSFVLRSSIGISYPLSLKLCSGALGSSYLLTPKPLGTQPLSALPWQEGSFTVILVLNPPNSSSLPAPEELLHFSSNFQ